MPLPLFQIENALLADAAEIVAAREKALLLHRTRDIGAAGDEVEIAARSVIARRLPSRCVVTHGHVVDSRLTTSSQLDIIVADRTTSTSMFKSANGTEYIPYECVYAVGEIKSCYYKNKHYISDFVSALQRLRTELNREPTPPHPLVRPGQPRGDALFSFMIFASSGDFDTGDVTDAYRNHPAADLPNVVCLLDRGVIINTKTSHDADGKVVMGGINITPGVPPEAYGPENLWSLVNFGEPDVRCASSLAMLLVALNEHVNRSILRTPPLLEYFRNMFTVTGGTTIYATGDDSSAGKP